MRASLRPTSFSRWVIRRRWFLLGTIALLTAGLAYATRYLVVNNDYDTWLPAHDRVSELYRLVDRQFSSTALLFAVLDCSDKGVFDPESLALVQRMTDALEGIDELFNVSSLTNILDVRKTELGLEVGELVPEIPESRQELEALKAYVLSKEMYVDTLVSSDAAYTVLIANIDGRSNEIDTAAKVLDTVHRTAGGHPYYFGGDPALILYANMYMNQDLSLLVPVMIVVMIGVLALSFRRVLGVVLPLLLVLLCIVWTFGLQAIFGIYVNVFTPAVVVLLIAMGADYSVHIYNHFLRRGDIEASTREITPAVVMSAVTTIAGVLTFGTTRIDLLRFFGIELAFGLGTACILSILLLPVCLLVLRARPEASLTGGRPGEHVVSRTLVKVGGWIHRRGKTTLAAALVGLVAMGLGFFRITTNVDYVEFMPEDSPPRIGGNILRDHFSGFYPTAIYLRGDMEDPAVLGMQSYLENYLRSYEMTSAFTSISGWIAEENWLMNGVFAVPETRQGIANLWLLLEGEDLLKTFVTEERDQALITALIKEPKTAVMRYISRSVAEFLDKETSDAVLVIDPERLPADGRRVLWSIRLCRAASQIAWLADGYDKPHRYDPGLLQAKLEEALGRIDQDVDLAPVWGACRAYLQEEALESLPPGLIEKIVTMLRKAWQGPEGMLEDRVAGTIVAAGAMGPEDAAETATGVIRRARSTLRIQRASFLLGAVDRVFPPRLREHKDFRKRAEGVLWGLWADRPALFTTEAASIPGLDQAVVSRKALEVEPSGFPDLVRRFDDLLYASQIQSLVLASLIVLVLISLTQRSLLRGLVSLLSVLVPLGYVLGLMGWSRIPLDFGTVLFGALIIGLGVDGSIHFLHYYHGLQRRGIRGERALKETMGHVGRAVVTANATTCCGFLVLLFSKTSVLRNFGLVNSAAILLVTVSLMTFLPALITVLRLDDRGGRYGPKDREGQEPEHSPRKEIPS